MKDFSHQFRTPGFLKKKKLQQLSDSFKWASFFFFSLNGEMIKQPFNE